MAYNSSSTVELNGVSIAISRRKATKEERKSDKIGASRERGEREAM